jgi:hypothetical protein
LGKDKSFNFFQAPIVNIFLTFAGFEMVRNRTEVKYCAGAEFAQGCMEIKLVKGLSNA